MTGDPETNARFDARAQGRRVELLAVERRTWLLLAGVAVAAMPWGGVRRAPC